MQQHFATLRAASTRSIIRDNFDGSPQWHQSISRIDKADKRDKLGMSYRLDRLVEIQ
jgi:hypothetical protein